MGRPSFIDDSLILFPQNTRIVFNSLEGNYALCLLANLIHLASLLSSKLQEHRTLFTNVITKLLESCRKYVQLKKSNLTHWHPVLGYALFNGVEMMVSDDGIGRCYGTMPSHNSDAIG